MRTRGTSKVHSIPYVTHVTSTVSLDITPSSIISTPYYLYKFAAEVCLSPIYARLGYKQELCDSNK